MSLDKYGLEKEEPPTQYEVINDELNNTLIVIPANDTRIYSSENDWSTNADLGYIEAMKVGAYIELEIDGSSSLRLKYSNNFTLCTLAWNFDNGLEQTESLNTSMSERIIIIASNLSITVNHKLKLYLKTVVSPEESKGFFRLFSVMLEENATLYDSNHASVQHVDQDQPSPPNNTFSPPDNTSSSPNNTSSPPNNISSPPSNQPSPPKNTPSPPKNTPLPPSTVKTKGFHDIAANDSRIYRSSYNWFIDEASGDIETINPGAYLKLTFNGSSLKLVLDNSFRNILCTLAWTVDDEPEQSTSSGIGVSTILTVASSLLNQNTNHTLYLFVKNFVSDDRWYHSNKRLRINSIRVDEGATIFAPALAPISLLAYWDSIGEGAYTNGKNANWQVAHDAHLTWAFSLSLALNAELSLVAFPHQGYVKEDRNKFPKLWSSSGLSNESSWEWLSADHRRSFATCPEYILCGHGSNDKGLDEHKVFNNSLGWMMAMRRMCPISVIFVVVPFGQWLDEAITRAFRSYQGTAGNDTKIHLIRLGGRASQGLKSSHATFESADGFHPYGWKSSQIGALLVAKLIPHLSKETLDKLDG